MPVPSQKIAFQTVKVRQVIPQTHDTHTLRLNTFFDYRPGQFIQVMIPGDNMIRSYSLSSSPTESGFVDFTVKAEPGGHVSNLLLELKEGGTVDIKGPFGAFSLPEPPTAPLNFIAAGSGVTPFRAMNKYLIDKHVPVAKWLFYSARTPSDLIFHSEFQAWQGNASQFNYVPTVTRSFNGPWPGETGHLNEEMLRRHLPKIEGKFLLCGPPVFVASMAQLLSGPLQVPAAAIRNER